MARSSLSTRGLVQIVPDTDCKTTSASPGLERRRDRGRRRERGERQGESKGDREGVEREKGVKIYRRGMDR